MRPETPLPHSFSLWVTWYNNESAEKGWEPKLERMCSFSTVEEFWRAYSHVKRSSEIDEKCSINISQDPIVPTWEDEANVKGGKTFFTVNSVVSSRFFEDVAIALLGGQFEGLGVTGICSAIKSTQTSIAVWNGDSKDYESIEEIRSLMRSVCSIPEEYAINYKAFFK